MSDNPKESLDEVARIAQVHGDYDDRHWHYGRVCGCDWRPPLLFPTPYPMFRVTFVGDDDE